MKLHLPLAAAACAALLPAQEASVAVPDGREIREHKLLTLGKTDSWNLEVETGEFLWCKVSSGAFDPVLSLVDSDGRVLAQNDGEGTSSELRLRSPVPGKVSLQVCGYEGSGGGQYDFWLQRYPVDPIDARGEASAELDESRWHHWAVELKAGDILVPRVTGEGRLTGVFDLEQRTPPEAFGGYRVDRDGTWFVRVEGPREGRTVRIHCALAEQAELPAGGPGETTLRGHGLKVWRLRAEAERAYSIHLRLPSADFSGDLRERPGTAPANARGPAFVWAMSQNKGGEVRQWIVVKRPCELEYFMRHKGPSEAPYDLEIREIDELLATATTFEDTLHLGSARCLALDTEPGQLLRITMQSEAFDPRFELWAPDGSVLHRADDRGPLDRNAEFTFLVQHPGIHRLLATSVGGGGAGGYTLRADPVEIPELQIGGEFTLDLRPPATGYGQLHLAAGDEIWLATRSDACDTAITVLAPDGTNVGTWEDGMGDDVLQGLTAQQGGRYTLLIHARHGAGACTVRCMRAL